jgi:hypothetical protein
MATREEEGAGSGAEATGETGGRACDWTGMEGADATLAVVCGSMRDELPKGFVNGVSVKRIASELQAAEAPAMVQTKATRATVFRRG